MNATPCDRQRCGAGSHVAAKRARAALRRLAAVAGALALTACASMPTAVPEVAAGPWDRAFEPPAPAASPRFVLEPAVPAHAERDHAALMASAEHLRTTVFEGWPPRDFSLEQDQRELERHAEEFDRREAYAYTVLTPDRGASLGAVLMKPVRATEGEGLAVQLTYWVAAREIPRGLDEHLIDTLLAWIERDWPFEEVLLPLREENRRAASLARAAGLDEHPPPSFGWRLFVHRR